MVEQEIRVGIERSWAMPSRDTFSIRPIGRWAKSYLERSRVSVDPFARNCEWATFTNDLNPGTKAQFHLPADEFCLKMLMSGIQCDLLFFDPPYSPGQISECYKGVGRSVTTQDTQNAALYKRCRDAADKIVIHGGVVLSFGWNSSGMGKGRGYKLMDVLMCCHGGAHNDTICIAERKMETTPCFSL